MKCPRCGNHLQSKNSICSACGYYRSSAQPPNYINCDRCGAPVLADAVKCTVCSQWSRKIRRDMNFVRLMAYVIAPIPAIIAVVLLHRGIVHELTHRTILLTFVAFPALCLIIALPVNVRVCMRIGRFWWF